MNEINLIRSELYGNFDLYFNPPKGILVHPLYLRKMLEYDVCSQVVELNNKLGSFTFEGHKIYRSVDLPEELGFIIF